MHSYNCERSGLSCQETLALFAKREGRKTFNCIGCWQDIDVDEPNRKETEKEYTQKAKIGGEGIKNEKNNRNKKAKDKIKI